jgi:hypothetical protein
MAEDEARAIASAVEVEKHTMKVAAPDDGPFASQTTEIDRGEPHVVGDWPIAADFVEALSPLFPSPWPRLGREQRSDRVDLGLIHVVEATVRVTAKHGLCGRQERLAIFLG